jgi:transcription factor SPN1
VFSNYILLNYLPYPSYLQTLDALPAHVLTPFIGPVPPSNLLDKIARGVSQAKGPSDWPYSLRSTRAKLVELCRVRAKEVSAEQKLYNTIEEEDMDQDLEQFREVLKRTTNIKRPLYRQNSMDFMQSAKLDLRRTDAFSRYVFLSSMYFTRFDFYANFLRHRTSHRLRNSDHLFPNPAYHTRPSSIDSQTLNVSTPSSTTLISCGTAESQWKAQPSRSSIRRSVSSMSSTSSSSLRSLPLAPVRRTDSFGEARKSMKRVPSFSVAAKDSDVSSDEEENLRTKKTKKARRGTDHRVNKLLSSQDESPVRRPRMNLQRNPSILGPELPHNPPSAYPQPAAAHLLEQIPAMGAHPPPPTQSPRTPCTQRTLRRMRPLPTRAARRISFSSLGENDLVSEPVDIIPSEDPGNGLGSAFQLR